MLVAEQQQKTPNARERIMTKRGESLIDVGTKIHNAMRDGYIKRWEMKKHLKHEN
jgi:hypothetical protein